MTQASACTALVIGPRLHLKAMAKGAGAKVSPLLLLLQCPFIVSYADRTHSRARLEQAAKAASAQDKADRQAAAAEAAEAAKWDEGSSKKGNKKADKDAEAARKREEKARLQAEEEEATNSIKPKAGAGGGKKNKDQAPKKVSSFKVPDLEVASVNASGIDNVLDGLDVATGKTDKASLGSKVQTSISHSHRVDFVTDHHTLLGTIEWPGR